LLRLLASPLVLALLLELRLQVQLGCYCLRQALALLLPVAVARHGCVQLLTKQLKARRRSWRARGWMPAPLLQLWEEQWRGAETTKAELQQ